MPTRSQIVRVTRAFDKVLEIMGAPPITPRQLANFKKSKQMTDEELMKELRSESSWNKARYQFSQWYAKIEQGSLQRRPLTPVEIRKMEFQAVLDIVAAYMKET